MMQGAVMADALFVWDGLGKYKAEGRFLDGMRCPRCHPARHRPKRRARPGEAATGHLMRANSPAGYPFRALTRVGRSGRLKSA